MTFTRTAELPVDLDEAFALITQPERLRRWQTVSARVDLRVGGDYRWTVIPGHRAAGTFKEIEPGKRIVFGWGWEGSDLLPDASTVTITLEPSGTGTRVTLTHEGLTDAQAASHAEGWNHYFERLEKLAVEGDAGHDEWAWAPDPMDPLTAAEAALTVLQPILRALTVEDQVRQTPCTEYDCHKLAEHLFGSLVALGAMAGASVTNPGEGSLENRVSVMTDQVITAWLAYDEATVANGDLPSEAAQTILSIELLVHAWDFAQATGQQVLVSDGLVNYVADRARPIIEGARERGAFGPELHAAEGASALDQLAAFSGRALLATVA
jgi:uncharacterized protein (TIGR03086 family)